MPYKAPNNYTVLREGEAPNILTISFTRQHAALRYARRVSSKTLETDFIIWVSLKGAASSKLATARNGRVYNR